MTPAPAAPEDLVEVPAALASMRRYALDGALLLFDRRTGLTAVCDGPETAALRMRAPRVVQFAITNACNLACSFCSRDLDASSAWTADEAFETLRALSARGALEVAFGGGEPLAFKGFAALARRLYEETELAVSLTTNGALLTDATLDALAPVVGQVRLSVYDDLDHRPIVARLARSRARFGVNWLVTPARLPSVEAAVLDLYARGCRDALLLAYNGRDASMHLSRSDSDALAERVRVLALALRGRMAIKLDVCWGERMERVPRLFDAAPCPAGREFIVLTSDKRVSPCSFHHVSFAAGSADEVMRAWERHRAALASPAADPGCARVDDFGLGGARRRLPQTG